MTNYFQEYRLKDVEQAEALDVDAERERLVKENPDWDSVYPGLCGVLQYHHKNVTGAARALFDELVKVHNRKEALEWAAEHVLSDEDISTHDGGEVFELLYATADVIEKALNGGMSTDELRKKLSTEMTDEDRKAGRFLPKCDDCGDSFDEDDQTTCELCRDGQEAQAEADAWNASEATQHES